MLASHTTPLPVPLIVKTTGGGSPTAPVPSAPGGLLARYLRDPDGTVHHLAAALWRWVDGPGRTVGPVIFAAVVAVLAAREWWTRRCQARMVRDGRLVTILAPPTVDPAGAIGLWSNLVGLLRPAWRRRVGGRPHVAFEYVFTPDGLRLRLWVPAMVPPGMIERAIEAAWPGAHTSTDHNDGQAWAPGNTAGVGVGGELRLARSEALPIATEHAADPLRALLGAPVGLVEGETVIVQVLARPVAGRRVAQARRAARRLHAGQSARPVGRILDLITPHTHPARSAGRGGVAAGGVDRLAALEYSQQDRAIVAKQRSALFETRVRYLVTNTATDPSGPGRRARGQTLGRLRGRAHAVASAFAVFGGHNHHRRHRLRHPHQAIRWRRFGRGDLLSIPELAVLAHIPTDSTVAGLQQAGARAVPPPPGIPTPDRAGQRVKPLGIADTGTRRPVGLAVPDARHHLHLLGATGSGKSTLMAQLILADAHAGRGVVVIDPKGDLVTDLLDRLPANAADRVVLFDADSHAQPPCLNPLHPATTQPTVTTAEVGSAGRGDDQAAELGVGQQGPGVVAVDNLTSVFARVYSAFWGPRTDDIFRAACLTLTAQSAVPTANVTTLADLPRLLVEPKYRARAVAHIQDPVLKGFWAWYEQLSDAGRAQAVAPLMNKLRAFLLRPFVRKALAAGPSTIDMSQILDGGICLVCVPKGSLGEETTKLIGSLVVAQVWQAATARAAQPQHERRDAGLYVDECQNFLNLPYELQDMLAEARGFRLSMTLAHQHLGQLGRDLKDGISANARSKVFFNASPEDARDLARHTAPRLSEHDLSHLGAYHAAARLVVNGEETASFTLHTTPLPAPVPGRATAIRKAADRAQQARLGAVQAAHAAQTTATATPAPVTVAAARTSVRDPRAS